MLITFSTLKNLENTKRKLIMNLSHKTEKDSNRSKIKRFRNTQKTHHSAQTFFAAVALS